MASYTHKKLFTLMFKKFGIKLESSGQHLSISLSFNICTGHNRRNANILRHGFTQHNLHQRHPVLVNDKGYTLDLLLNNIQNVSVCTPIEVLSRIDMHHPPCLFKFSYKCKFNDNLEYEITYCIFRKCYYEKINHDLGIINWTNGLANLDSEGIVDFLYSQLNKLISDHVPLKTRKSFDFPFWFSRELIL